VTRDRNARLSSGRGVYAGVLVAALITVVVGLAVGCSAKHTQQSASTQVDSTIPDVAGLTPEQAEQKLRGAGFTNLHSSQVVSATALLGKVVATKPPANSRLSPRDEILVIVGTGPLQHLIPDCVSATADQCEQRLAQAGFINHLRVGDNGNPLQRVVVTDPPVGQIASIDTSVSIHLGP
jgi:beta-lactam-binding protein with PASTA domain